MQRRGWSEYRLAQEAGISYNAIRRILDEQRRPSARVQAELADALDVEVTDIWDRLPLGRRLAVT